MTKYKYKRVLNTTKNKEDKEIQYCHYFKKKYHVKDIFWKNQGPIPQE